jgi:hypothetical protein
LVLVGRRPLHRTATATWGAIPRLTASLLAVEVGAASQTALAETVVQLAGLAVVVDKQQRAVQAIAVLVMAVLLEVHLARVLVVAGQIKMVQTLQQIMQGVAVMVFK